MREAPAQAWALRLARHGGHGGHGSVRAIFGIVCGAIALIAGTLIGLVWLSWI